MAYDSGGLSRYSRPLAILLVLVIVLSACGSGSGVSTPSLSSQGASTSVISTPPIATDISFACGKVRVDDPGDVSQYPVYEINDLFATFGEAAVASVGDFGELEFRIVEQTNTTMSLLGDDIGAQVGVHNRTLFSATLELVDGDWSSSSLLSRCDLKPDMPGFNDATVTFDSTSPSPEDTALQLLATENACANGEPPNGREVLTTAIETGDEVQIFVFVATITEGEADCPGNPSFPITITLHNPVGERKIVDGSEFPPVTVTDESRPEPLPIAAARTCEPTDPECDPWKSVTIDGTSYERSCTEVANHTLGNRSYAEGLIDGNQVEASTIEGTDLTIAVRIRKQQWPECDGTLKPRNQWARYDKTGPN